MTQQEDLGIIISSTFSFEKHILSIVSQSNRKIGIIKSFQQTNKKTVPYTLQTNHPSFS